jgi:hypothetical protein
LIQAADGYRGSVLESLLNRYGFAYICHNPLILFSKGPAETARSPYPLYYGCPPGGNDGAGQRYPRGRSEGLSERITEAYEILNQMYAPWPAPGAWPQDSSYSRPAHKPACPPSDS